MKIVVIAVYPIVRKGIISITSKQKDIQISGEATDMKGGLQILKEIQPEIALVDVSLGSNTGLDLILRAKQEGLLCKFILMGFCNSEDFIVRAIRLGVDGYFLREAQPVEILYTINQVKRGKKHFDASFLELICDTSRDEIPNLTPREIEILIELGNGLTNKQIAKIFYITEHTVKKHVNQILHKLELNNRTQAAIFANTKELVVKYE